MSDEKRMSEERVSPEAYAAMDACDRTGDAPLDCTKCDAHGVCFLSANPNCEVFALFRAERAEVTRLREQMDALVEASVEEALLEAVADRAKNLLFIMSVYPNDTQLAAQELADALATLDSETEGKS